MDKSILEQYSDSKARVKYLRQSVDKLEKKIKGIEQEGYKVSDSVTCGRKGKKPLGTVKISGFPVPEYDRLKEVCEKRKAVLQKEEQELNILTVDVEKYISGIKDVEIRNILSLYYIEDLNWIQVAHRMNGLYCKKKTYSDSSCRQKHDRFLEKLSKTAVLADTI